MASRPAAAEKFLAGPEVPVNSLAAVNKFLQLYDRSPIQVGKIDSLYKKMAHAVAKGSPTEKAENISKLRSLSIEWGMDFDSATNGSPNAIAKLVAWCVSKLD